MLAIGQHWGAPSNVNDPTTTDPATDPYGQCCPVGAECIRPMPRCAIGTHNLPSPGNTGIVPPAVLCVSTGGTWDAATGCKMPSAPTSSIPLLTYIVFGGITFLAGAMLLGGKSA